MGNDILTELQKSMKERNIKIPALAKKIKIPKDRIYKWYQEGTAPKTEDANTIWKWIKGDNSNDEDGENNNLKEDDTTYFKEIRMRFDDAMKVIGTQANVILEQQATIKSQQDLIQSLSLAGISKKSRAAV